MAQIDHGRSVRQRTSAGALLAALSLLLALFRSPLGLLAAPVAFVASGSIGVGIAVALAWLGLAWIMRRL